MYKITPKNLQNSKKNQILIFNFFKVNILNMNGLGTLVLVENMCQMFLLE